MNFCVFKQCKFVTISFIALLLVITIPNVLVTCAQSDTDPPQLTIYDQNCVTPDSTIIVHGSCIDESGIQKVTVNGELASGYFTDIHYFWQRTVSLTEGINTIVITAYDNSANHNELTDTSQITYQTVSYDGPTIRTISVTSQPSNNATLQCIINPNGLNSRVYSWASYSSWENAPFNWGYEVDYFSGTGEILVNYTIPGTLNLPVGESISYMFTIKNSEGTDFTTVETFQVTEPISMADNEPPIIQISNYEDFETPNSEVMINPNVWDASGVKNVTVNGEMATGRYDGEWFFGKKTIELIAGKNFILVKAYDNSSENNVSEKNFTITYQPSGYLGPTISSLLPSNITSNSVTLSCVINPKGLPYTKCYLWLGETSCEFAPFCQGRSLGEQHSGTQDITINYNYETNQPETTISFIFYVDSGHRRAYTELMTLTLKRGLATFSTNPETAFALLPVTFDATSCFSPFGSIETYTWNFGDGNKTTTTEPTILHVYETSGDFDVNLSVLDAFGLTNSTTSNVAVLSDTEAPITSLNYDDLWHNSNFTLILSANDSGSGVAETYYKLNSGEKKSISTDGEPHITVENENNSIEFWSVDNIGNVENSQVISGIKLDLTDPVIETPSISPNDEIKSDQEVNVSVGISDSLSGVETVTLLYSTNNGTIWNDIPMTINSMTGLWEAIIPGQSIWTQVKYKIMAYDLAGNNATSDDVEYYKYEVIPEFQSETTLILFGVLVVSTIVVKKKLTCSIEGA